jgi:TRAP-type uncharacterized transport system substrate-binding protein
VIEIASEIVNAPDQPNRLAMVLLRPGMAESPEWQLGLFGSNSHEGIEAVINKRAALAIVNPSAQLALAYRGSAPYQKPQPVRTLAVIPSLDQFAFAVRKGTGLKTFEDIAAQRYPLKISVRGQKDHSLHFLLDHIMEAAGFSLKDLRSWGGDLRKEGTLPYPEGPKFVALARGEIDGIFDEAVDEWLDKALSVGMTILPLSEATVRKVEAKGCRRAIIPKSRYLGLPQDVLTIDFSGWPIFVHADTPDRLVTQFCAALEARKHRIPWQGQGPLPTERMCRDAPENPIDVPLHPAAERFWRQCGYL